MSAGAGGSVDSVNAELLYNCTQDTAQEAASRKPK